jgi:hypothetical protein
VALGLSNWAKFGVYLVLCHSLVLFSCKGRLDYKPPVIPIKISVDSNGKIEVSINNTVATPVGVFSIHAVADLDQLQSSHRTITVSLNGFNTVYSIDAEKGELELEFESGFYEQIRFEQKSRHMLLLLRRRDSKGSVAGSRPSTPSGVITHASGPIRKNPYPDNRTEHVPELEYVPEPEHQTAQGSIDLIELPIPSGSPSLVSKPGSRPISEGSPTVNESPIAGTTQRGDLNKSEEGDAGPERSPGRKVVQGITTVTAKADSIELHGVSYRALAPMKGLRLILRLRVENGQVQSIEVVDNPGFPPRVIPQAKKYARSIVAERVGSDAPQDYFLNVEFQWI